MEEFTIYLKEIGYSKSSQYMLPHCISEFLSFLKNREITQITEMDIYNFYDYLQERPLKRRIGVLSESMKRHYIFSLNVFFSWLEQTEQLNVNPMSNISFQRKAINTREPLSQYQIKQLFEACENHKERAILHLFYSCGLRRAEAQTLKLADIHLKESTLYVRSGKGAKRRAVPMNQKVVEAFENYILLERFNPNNLDAFVLNIKGLSMSGNSFNLALKNIASKAEIILNSSFSILNFSLHHLRHSIATHLLENGLKIEYVRDFLGHKHLDSTQIYAKINQKNLRNL